MLFIGAMTNRVWDRAGKNKQGSLRLMKVVDTLLFKGIEALLVEVGQELS